MTADGYVFRVDLRLRPDAGATPVAISMEAAEQYYESMGQNWERAAMIKARAAAGDIEAGKSFLASLRPFIWRKHLDYAAIEDIHSIKRQIHRQGGHRAIGVSGHNVKLGLGGIDHGRAEPGQFLDPRYALVRYHFSVWELAATEMKHLGMYVKRHVFCLS